MRLTLDYNLIYHATQTLQALKHGSCLSMATFQRSSDWRAALSLSSCVFMVYVILSVDMETPVKIVGKLLLVTNLAATKRVSYPPGSKRVKLWSDSEPTRQGGLSRRRAHRAVSLTTSCTQTTPTSNNDDTGICL